MSDFTRTRSCGSTFFPTAETTSAGCSCGSSAVTSVSAPCPSPSQSGGGSGSTCTCCKASMRDALKLLCSNAVSDLVDFDSFAFITDDNFVGAEPSCMYDDARDNLNCLSGTFRRFSPCNCDMIDIAGRVTAPYCSNLEVSEASLCALAAIAFQIRPVCGEPNQNGCGCGCGCGSTCCSTDTNLYRYRRVRDLLQNELLATDRPCGECVCNCDCTNDCCCTTGVLNALSNTSLNKRTTLVAGLLTLRNVTALGTIGNVLVLGNEEDGRFYFVCANKVEFLA